MVWSTLYPLSERLRFDFIYAAWSCREGGVSVVPC